MKLPLRRGLACPNRFRSNPAGRMSGLAFAGLMLCCSWQFEADRRMRERWNPQPTEAKEIPMFLGLRTAKYDAQDLGKAKAWYAKVLGTEPYFDQSFYVGFSVRGYELGIVPGAKSEEARPASGVAYWGVEDARAAYQRLLDLGATPREEVQDVGEGILVGEVYDPFGNVLGVIQNPHFMPEAK